MCLILTAWHSHPEYSLVVVANRDEFYERATDQMHWWKDHPHILAGRDRADVLGQPGTWMGLSKYGKFAALTNVRAPSEKIQNPLTRGEISANYLTSQDKPETFISKHSNNFKHYNGFNFLAADISRENPQLVWFSNRILMGDSIRPRKTIHPQKLNPGVYGLSNAMLDSPWPKVQHRVGAFAQLLAMDTGIFKKSDAYIQMMEDSTQAQDGKLPKTGISYEWEKALSSAFIRTKEYGTRSISLIRVRHDGHFEAIEKRFDAEKSLGTEVFQGKFEKFSQANS